MQMTECESSHITAYGYDHTTETMAVQFKGGDVYHWSPVSRTVYKDFLYAESKGKFLHSVIRYALGDGVKQEKADEE